MIPTRTEALFALALTKSASQRADWLERECAGDPDLRQRLEALLASVSAKQGTPSLNADDPSVRVKECAPELAPTLLDETPISEGPGSVIGRYKLLEQIGEGGFGVVYVAEQQQPVRRQVALKIIKLGMDTRQVVARFEAERQALALMDHPNIAKVFDAGATDTGRPFFVMELVKGIPITHYCDQKKLATRDRLGLFIGVCQAIQHAHQKGIIHRDIKPSNILVTVHEASPVPKVIDFGIAKATQQKLTEKTLHTQLQQFIGTPAYMSPEQVEMSGLDIDTRSDIYSLGVLLYELLVGVTPFDAKEMLAAGLDEIRRTILEKEPARPSTRLSLMGKEELTTTAHRCGAEAPKLIGLLRGDLDWIVMKCLEKDRTRRYETANGVSMDIQRHLGNEPVVARPPTTIYRFQKAWRRNKLVYTAGAAIATALFIGVVGISLGLWRATRERANAQAAAQRAFKASTEAQQARELTEAKNAELETNLYFNRVALAHRELTSQPSNVELAKSLLEACPTRLRNWEWDHLNRRRFSDPLVLRNPGLKKIQSVAFSPDGRYLASGGVDGQVRIWSLVDRKVVQTLSGHTGRVVSVVFSPANPALVASAGGDKQVLLWDWQSGQKLLARPSHYLGGDGQAYALAFSPDGLRLAAPGNNGELMIWDTATGQLALRLAGHEELAACTCFSSDGRWIATGSFGGIVRLWDAASGQPTEVIGIFGPPVSNVAFSRNGRYLAASQVNGFLRVWDVEHHRELSYHRVCDPVLTGFAWHPNSERLAIGAFDRMVTISEPTTGRQVLVLRELARGCYCLRFSPDGTRLAAAAGDGTVHVWDATPLQGTEDRCARSLEYPGQLYALDVAQDGRSIAVSGEPSRSETNQGAMVFLWGSLGSQERLPGHGFIVFSLSHDPTGRFLASCGDRPTASGGGPAMARVWDLQAGREAFALEAFEGTTVLFSIAFSRDGRWLAAGSREGNIQIWDGVTGRKIGVLGEHSGEITKLVFSPDGKYLASVDDADTVKVWDAKRLDQTQKPLRVFAARFAICCDLVAFSPDDSQLVVCADDDTSIIHQVIGEDRPVRLTSRGHEPQAVAFSPDRRWVASGGVDCTVKIWDAETGELRDTLRSHSKQIVCLRFFQRPEGMSLVSGSRDGVVKVWDLGGLDALSSGNGR